MSLSPLRIIPAGAGSGKTYTIQTNLAQWIQDNQVNAERVVAVTFTEAAATELRERIRDELIRTGRHTDALKLDQAYISTIHGFGLRLLTEFAFDAGMNPSPRLLSEAEEEVLIRLALASDDSALEIMKDLAHFGYRFDFQNKKSAEDVFRDLVLSLMAKLRSIGTAAGPEPKLKLSSDLKSRSKTDTPAIQKALQRIKELYGHTSDAKVLEDNLTRAIEQTLKEFPEDMSAYCTTSGVKKAVKNDHFLLRKALKPGVLKRDWKLWQQLRELKISTKQNKLPQEYDEVIDAVKEAADRLPDHPGPLDDALTHCRALLGAAQGSLATYAENKQHKGLLDYTDMLALSRTLLQDNPAVLEILNQRFECLIIDEFQDTNPLQFSLLWLFHQAGIPTFIVGDVKQAIMGFQNADSRLLIEMQKQNPDCCAPLTGNWRTCSSLMAWINDVGDRLFGADYTRLQPRADFPAEDSNLEAIVFQKSAKQADRATHTVQRIKDLLADEDATIYDRRSKTRRRVKGGDIALICPRNKRLEQYADILRDAGIAVQMDEDGWLESRPVELLFHALSYVADPHDKHAALYMAVTELGEDSLESALQTLVQNTGDVTRLKSQILAGLDELAHTSAGRSVEDVVQDVISTLDLYTIVARWPQAPRHRANILRFEAEARDFERANREALASAGFYGHGLKTFLAWLQERTTQQDGNRQPGIGGANEDAVELVSWHRSKGREWPVVVLAACETEIIARVPDQGVSYADFSDLGAILDNAWIDISPEYAAPEKEEPFLDQIKEQSNDSAKRLLYVALTRAREKVILEWPAYLDNGKERKSYTYWELLTDLTKLTIDTNTMCINNNTYPCRVIKAGKEPVDISDSDAEYSAPLPEYGRRAIKPGTMPQSLTPEAVRPSVHDEEQGEATSNDETTASLTELQQHAYAKPLEIDIDLPPTELGTLLHRAFEIMQFDCSHTKLNRATGFNFTPEQYNTLHQQSAAFYTWVQNKFNPEHLHAEASILATDKNGSVISGYIDLLIETKEGYWIIDHKTDNTDDLEARFAYYLPQLQMYADSIRQQCPDKPVLGVGVNWVRDGVVDLRRC